MERISRERGTSLPYCVGEIQERSEVLINFKKSCCKFHPHYARDISKSAHRSFIKYIANILGTCGTGSLCKMTVCPVWLLSAVVETNGTFSVGTKTNQYGIPSSIVARWICQIMLLVFIYSQYSGTTERAVALIHWPFKVS